ncbi:MAG: flippase-like domain-containing protein [Proteobacteria bacterium]|nr:flippase-like domain-containing protein [Pseudomonadota bacterium]MCP4916495.1 flippase-like domain-containing protein [Pseudomonadota bacterium]
MGYGLIAVAFLLFGVVSWKAWEGALGLVAIIALAGAFGAFWVGRKKVDAQVRKKLDMPAKVLFTLVGIMALLRHPIDIEEGVRAPIYEAIALYIDQVDTGTFILYACIAMAVKFVGVISSAFAWHLLLKGQGIRFPFWSKIMTAFLIGRFIGTFLPSTLGLDGYTLYEAGRYSGQWPRAITAKALEKFIGVTGLFLGMVVTMPFGYQVIVDVTTKMGQPESAPLLAGAIAAVAGGVSAVVVVGLVWPSIIQWFARLFERILGGIGPLKKLVGILNQFTNAVGAYRGKVGLLMLALASKFVTHFTTAAVYFFTALAIGVTTAEFWPITFGSTIQILATLLSPTIAGEGAREAFQALLLSEQLGGVAQAVLSGALGFIAAEAATLWGGMFLWTRKAGWRPKFAEVDGQQVDYAWIDDEDDGGFDAEKIAKARAEHTQK